MVETQSLRFFYVIMLALPLTGMASESPGSSNTIVADGEESTPYVNPQCISIEPAFESGGKSVRSRYRQGSRQAYIVIYLCVLAAFAWTCCIAACHFIKRISPHLFVPNMLQ